jgi:tetratricopeptide (TPR) repeat protein
MPKAIAHWELCLAQNPNMILALNNLAVALSQADPPQFDRALDLLKRAMQVVGPDPELLDSHGEVLLRAGKVKDAITSLEQSLSLNPKRLGTRKQLEKAYRAADLAEQADAQLKQIQLLESQPSAKPDTAPSHE